MLTRAILAYGNDRVPICHRHENPLRHPDLHRAQPPAEQLGAAMVMVMPLSSRHLPRVRRAVEAFYQRLSDAINIPIMVQDAGGSARRCPPPSWPAWRRTSPTSKYFSWDAGRRRQDARADPPRRRHRRPWDGEEAITLLADLDAGATGAMAGAYPGRRIRMIFDASTARRPRGSRAPVRAAGCR